MQTFTLGGKFSRSVRSAARMRWVRAGVQLIPYGSPPMLCGDQFHALIVKTSELTLLPPSSGNRECDATGRDIGDWALQGSPRRKLSIE